MGSSGSNLRLRLDAPQQGAAPQTGPTPATGIEPGNRRTGGTGMAPGYQSRILPLVSRVALQPVAPRHLGLVLAIRIANPACAPVPLPTPPASLSDVAAMPARQPLTVETCGAVARRHLIRRLRAGSSRRTHKRVRLWAQPDSLPVSNRAVARSDARARPRVSPGPSASPKGRSPARLWRAGNARCWK